MAAAVQWRAFKGGAPAGGKKELQHPGLLKLSGIYVGRIMGFGHIPQAHYWQGLELLLI